jgi:hypothetical protein
MDGEQEQDPPALVIKGLRRPKRRRDLGEGLIRSIEVGLKPRDLVKKPNPQAEKRRLERADELKDAMSSTYFWWWVFLGESEDYRAASKGREVEPKVAALAEDFGDVVNRSFEGWWFNTGRYLFAQKRDIPKVKKMEDGLVHLRGEQKQCLYLEVPKAIRRSTALRQINKILGSYYKTEDGGRHNVFEFSQARREINKSSKMRLATFKQFYDVWQDRKNNPDSPWWETGERLKISPTFINYPNTNPLDRAANNRNMALTVQRIYRKCEKLIHYAARGEFPRTK